MVKVHIPTPLRRLTGDKAIVDVNGKSIREIIEALEKAFPGIKKRLCEEDGSIRKFINVYVGEEDIRFLDGIDTEVRQEDVNLVPAIAGG